MTQVGKQRQYIQILTGIGVVISIALFIFFQQHQSYFQVGGAFQQYLGQMGLLAPIIFYPSTNGSGGLPYYSWGHD